MRRPSEIMTEWRTEHWPPQGLIHHRDPRADAGEAPGLNVYYGGHDAVAAFAETLSLAMAGVANHIWDKCKGRKPRWMAVPKIFFNVERMNITRSTGKISVTFESIGQLTEKCGKFSDSAIDAMNAWLDIGDDARLVAHKPVNDIRAYIIRRCDPTPARVHFHHAGLVVGVDPGVRLQDFTIQDQRTVKRSKRNDSLTNLIATNSGEWSVYGITLQQET